MNTLPALLLAAAGVGIGHAVMPDHWLPLAVLSRTRRYRATHVARLSLAAALAHVVVSVVLGGILIVIGLQFRATVARHADLFVGSILLATGAVFLALEVRGKAHRHSGPGHDDGRDHGRGSHAHFDGHRDHGRAHDHYADGHALGHTTTAVLDRPERSADERSASGLAGLLIPFGAAASPDLTILPVFLAASALGSTAALGSLAAFTLATTVTIVGLTSATALGARVFTASWIDRSAGLITAVTLIVIGVLAVSGLI